ncbi:MAG: YMGG-like glycine zipper-containing protein [Phycisphaerae bacterium]|nr:YMGG-like glycine zipper-containing protein [Phycisphaerae bacterium]
MAMALGALLLLVGGCQNSAQRAGLIGAAIGAAAGAGIDHDDRGRGALIGTAVGALAGYAVGNEHDKARYGPPVGYRQPAPPPPVVHEYRAAPPPPPVNCCAYRPRCRHVQVYFQHHYARHGRHHGRRY